MKQHLKAILRAIDYLDGHPEPSIADYEQLRYQIWQVEKRATREGLPAIVAACQVPEGPLWPAEARRIVATCIAACPVEESATLTPPQVAREVSASPDTVLNWIRSGQLKASQLGTRRRRYVIQRSELERFLASRQPLPPSRRSIKRY